jgi:hypothetical protein
MAQPLDVTGQAQLTEHCDGVAGKIDGEAAISRLRVAFDDEGLYASQLQGPASCQAGDTATRDNDAPRIL